MATAAELDLLRQHVNADDLGGVDDVKLAHYWDTAIEYVIAQTQRTRAELIAMSGTGELPRRVIQAALMVAAGMYDVREDRVSSSMKYNPQTAALIRSLRRMGPRPAADGS